MVDEHAVGVVPKLIQGNIQRTPSPSLAEADLEPRREFRPETVTRLSGTLPWDTNSKQLQCGETITTNSGEMALRINMEAVVLYSELKTLFEMRNDPRPIDMVSPAYNGPITFDQLKWDRVPDANGQIVRGEANEEPLYEIQLQNKEQDEEEGGIFG